jgi:hydroxymethylglutaryl-CoA lyase
VPGERVEIVEVGPRDGLQNEPRPIPTTAKILLVDALSEAGFRRIEVASFVSPRRVPQMADGAGVLAGIRRRPGVRYTALVPNMTGWTAALEAGVDEVAIFASASEGFSQANLNCSISESLDRMAPVADAALAARMPLRGYVSCVTHCPFDGPTPPAAVAEVTAALRDLGCHEVSLGDTLGRAGPPQVTAMLEAALAEMPAGRLAGHYHDTGGRALENIEVSLALGLRVFDASIGGLGGCPFAPGASGNVATGAVHARLTALGFDTGLDAGALRLAADVAFTLKEGRDV